MLALRNTSKYMPRMRSVSSPTFPWLFKNWRSSVQKIYTKCPSSCTLYVSCMIGPFTQLQYVIFEVASFNSFSIKLFVLSSDHSLRECCPFTRYKSSNINMNNYNIHYDAEFADTPLLVFIHRFHDSYCLSNIHKYYTY